ncbi:MAG: inositol monophosphatase family protein [Symbiopectobacterium sp.]
MNADQEAERAIRALISTHHPEHAILGEELSAVDDGETQWIFDPVDETQPFLCGIPMWEMLMGLLYAAGAPSWK